MKQQIKKIFEWIDEHTIIKSFKWHTRLTLIIGIGGYLLWKYLKYSSI